MSRIMALDLGEKRVGVALSDQTQTLATPFTVIKRFSFAQLLERIEQIAAEQQASALVIGFPLSLNGDDGPQAQHIRSEAERIAERVKLPLTLWDERLSTVRTEQLLSSRRGARRRKQPIDDKVAALILQEYLDAQRRDYHSDDEDVNTHDDS
ncbi:MAG: Holliday junction resolvase RuvX [Chloroflexi bacterium]|nr:Holliday junction resolvase RuvX [Chloroflexota bacterium]